MKAYRLFIFLLVLTLTPISESIASQIAQLDLNELLDRTDVILLGKVLKVEEKQLGSSTPPPFDQITVEVASVLKGKVERHSLNLIIQPRGLKGFDPALNIGDMGMFFLRDVNESNAKLTYWGSVAIFQRQNFKLSPGTESSAQPKQITDDEYKVYSDLLLQLQETSAKGQLWVIKDFTILGKTGHAGYDFEKFKSHLKKDFGNDVSDDLLGHFISVNAEPQMLESKFESSLNIAFISKEKEEELFKPVGNGWTRFYAAYPKAKNKLELSRVAFNNDKTKALVCYGMAFDYKGGVGYHVLLTKTGNKWVITKKVMAWVV